MAPGPSHPVCPGSPLSSRSRAATSPVTEEPEARRNHPMGVMRPAGAVRTVGPVAGDGRPRRADRCRRRPAGGVPRPGRVRSRDPPPARGGRARRPADRADPARGGRDRDRYGAHRPVHRVLDGRLPDARNRRPARRHPVRNEPRRVGPDPARHGRTRRRPARRRAANGRRATGRSPDHGNGPAADPGDGTGEPPSRHGRRCPSPPATSRSGGPRRLATLSPAWMCVSTRVGASFSPGRPGPARPRSSPH